MVRDLSSVTSWGAVHVSIEQTLVPPNRSFDPNFDSLEIQMANIEDEVSLHPRKSRWNGQDRRLVLFCVSQPPEFPNRNEGLHTRFIIQCVVLLSHVADARPL
jgi:hypothetical protein